MNRLPFFCILLDSVSDLYWAHASVLRTDILSKLLALTLQSFLSQIFPKRCSHKHTHNRTDEVYFISNAMHLHTVSHHNHNDNETHKQKRKMFAFASAFRSNSKKKDKRTIRHCIDLCIVELKKNHAFFFSSFCIMMRAWVLCVFKMHGKERKSCIWKNSKHFMNWNFRRIKIITMKILFCTYSMFLIHLMPCWEIKSHTMQKKTVVELFEDELHPHTHQQPLKLLNDMP